MGESPEAKVAQGLSVLSSATTKPIRVQAQTNWVGSPGVGENSESV